MKGAIWARHAGDLSVCSSFGDPDLALEEKQKNI